MIRFRLLCSLVLFLFSDVKGNMEFELIALEKTDLAEIVASKMGKELHLSRFRTFADGEINVELPDSERFAGKAAVIIQSTGHPVNEHLLGVAFLARELANAGAQKIIAMVPYFGYSRQERSSIKGKPGHAAVVAKLLEGAGIDELITVELHDDSLIDFFSIPVQNLSVQKVIADHIKKSGISLASTCLVAPDKGAAAFIDAIAQRIGLGTLVFEKERFASDQTRITGIVGACEGTTGIVIDDIIATGSTALNVCNSLPGNGYRDIVGYFVHPVLAGPAIERIASSCFSKVYVGNTLPLSKEAQSFSNIEQFDVSPVIVDALKKVV